MTPQQSEIIRGLVAKAVAAREEMRINGGLHLDWPRQAYEAEQAVHVSSTETLFAYYLGADGTVYELDLDSSRGLEAVTGAATIRAVYAEAAERYPQLGKLG